MKTAVSVAVFVIGLPLAIVSLVCVGALRGLTKLQDAVEGE